MIDSNVERIIKSIVNFAKLSAILEVSSRKPGNVSPQHDFSDTTYEDFLAGSFAIGEGIEEAVRRGFLVGKREIPLKEIKIGELIEKCVIDVKNSHSGGNTHLGMIMLMVPISIAGGMCISQNDNNDNKFKNLKTNISRVIENSTLEDSLHFYDVIKISNVGGLKGKLKEPKIPFHELMKISSKKDRIAEELINGLKITFWVSNILGENFRRIGDIRKAILQSYIETLAKFPDTFIAKKVGVEKAKDVSKKAKDVLQKGGIFTKDGKQSIKKLDLYLRNEENNKLNPGTTADIISAGLMIWLLKKHF
jgi:triphosphoribosyl-dephospho-CoA synthase